MAVSDTIQRTMPSNYDRQQGHILDYKEAVLLTNPTNPRFKGEVRSCLIHSINSHKHTHTYILCIYKKKKKVCRELVYLLIDLNFKAKNI